MVREKLDYSSSGVNIDEGNLFVEKIKKLVARTLDENVPENIGGFAGFYNIGFAKDMAEPMLVSSTDGVGTKLKIAFMMNKYDTVGIDLVAMCVNDIIVTGARPLFFLDYIATGKLSADKMVDVIKGITDGCFQSSVALLGGETAEMPGMYAEGEFDLAGFCVGIVDRKNVVNGESIKEGDILVGVKSSGLHSNGFSLVRKLFFEHLNMKIDDKLFNDRSLGEVLLSPTKIYVKLVLSILQRYPVKGMVHITGGGFYDNLPRVIKNGLGADIYPERFHKLEIFEYIRSLNIVDDKELFRVFNMGVGFVLVVDKSIADELVNYIKLLGEDASVIGEVTGINKIRIQGVDF
ncbi:phosphoribosylformylglycinamidine cyclo-ligase [Calditerrivibrio sp.]|uniref:phosphoribosylformylglycinamidine cyclo-ligase n=1 Tax=Calditerrivibrio sp. TaxID=2792612 RepID=UPI003D147B9A